jgi:NAD(P)-dependent dehydrogenase (short-subunit alcohol dehydrogenase family)
MTEPTPVAIVTGASRGIGRVTALALADAGFDVAITARTVREGDGRAQPSSVRDGPGAIPVPGSLETTAAEIEQRGRSALPIRLDLLDVAAVRALPATVLDTWGRIDVLFNNAITQQATMDRLLDLTAESMTGLVLGNYVHQVLLIQGVLPHMVDRGSGRIVNMASGSARRNPPGPPGDGGWGIGYSASKAAFGRVAGGIEAEFAGNGVRAFNVDPGYVVTEQSLAVHGGDQFHGSFRADPAEATAVVVTWLATGEEGLALAGEWIHAPTVAEERGLLTTAGVPPRR